MDELVLPMTEFNTATLQDEGEQPHEFIFHVEHGDYFAMIATILGFVEDAAQKLEEKDEAVKIAQEQITRLRKDLIYLQEHYCIEPKQKAKTS